MHNAAAVVALQEANVRGSELRAELLNNQMQVSTLQADNDELRNSLDGLHEATTGRHDEFTKLEGQLREELESAVELAEKQNALTITLESKVRFILFLGCLLLQSLFLFALLCYQNY